MLTELQVKNFAIIDSASISFGTGLNVLSGQTGAGKSILLQALEFLLGSKADQDSIRSGQDSLEVQAVFDLSSISPRVLSELPDLARDEAGSELVISRSLARTGRSKVLVNGRLASVSVLEEISSKLINICGQNQHVRLSNPRFHREVIDDFAGHVQLLERYSVAYEKATRLAKQLSELEQSLSRRASRETELQEVVADLEGLKLSPGRREELEIETKRLAQAETLISRSAELLELYDQEAGLAQNLAGFAQKAAELERLDAGFSQISALCQNGISAFEELIRELGRYARGIELDAGRLESLREELAELARLERKYRTNTLGLIDRLRGAKAELGALASTEDQKNLARLAAEARAELKQVADELSNSRLKAGDKLAKQAKHELAELNMGAVNVTVKMSRIEYAPTGQDEVEIMLAASKNEEPKPLRRVASGGELSRIMLVLKKILRDRSGVNVLVFDEVDVGISGAVARAVGDKLKSLSQDSQVLVVTHLPQVASMADHHFLVEKSEGERVRTLVRELSKSERIDEVARMLSGYEVTPAARASARELLHQG